MRVHAGWLLTVLLVAASLAAFPQTSARITLNVVAFDSHDQVVGDLTSQDFQISEEGKVQRIVAFRRDAESQAAAPVLILFDLLNENFANRGHGTEEIVQAVEHLESSDSLYLYLLTNQALLSPVRPLPAPHEENPVAKIPWTEHVRPLLEAAIGNVYGVKLGNTQGTLPAIETLGAALKPFPGRKNIVWITYGGASLSLGNAGPGFIDRLATTLDKEGVTLSSVNQATGVDSGDPRTLDRFADLTGGKVYFHDVEKAVKEAMAGSRSNYVIEYDAPQVDGKYHKIRVACSRKGVRLQVKQGYYAS